jgi:hypothetical protein
MKKVALSEMESRVRKMGDGEDREDGGLRANVISEILTVLSYLLRQFRLSGESCKSSRRDVGGFTFFFPSAAELDAD